MREGFEDTLRDYTDTVRELHQEGATVDRDTLFEPDIRELLEAADRRFHTNIGTQETILQLQEEKVCIMEALTQVLREIDAGAGVAGPDLNAIPVSYNPETNDLYVGEHHISEGVLYTDGRWGISYELPGTVPRAIRKRYAVAVAKDGIRELLNRQILHNEVGMRRPYSSTGAQSAPRSNSVFARALEGSLPMEVGNVAEKMVRTYLEKIAIDLDLDFRIVEADVHQDMIEKIDFVIHRKVHNRGVTVETSDRTDIGIQFTISESKERLEEKGQQVALSRKRITSGSPVDDIVLVSVPVRNVAHVYDAWRANPTPGGPEAAWSSDVQAFVIRGVLKGIVPDQEIEAVVEHIYAKEV
jgi:hypothetical protein